MLGDSATRLASHYSEEVGTSSDLRNSALVRLVISKVQGEKVLDIGCGSGYLLGELEKEGKKVFGVEPNHEILTLFHKRYPSIPVVEETVETLDQVVGSFDTITLLDVLEHVEDDRAALDKIYKKLVPGGQFIVVVPANRFLYGKRDKAMGHYRRYGKNELVSKIKDVGFVIDEARHWNVLAFFPYLLAEKVLRQELKFNERTGNASGIKSFIKELASWWLSRVEHTNDFHFGLSLIVVASRPID